MIKMKQKGKYLKKAAMIMFYGSSYTRTAFVTRLGLRRTRVLYKASGYLRVKMISNSVPIS